VGVVAFAEEGAYRMAPQLQPPVISKASLGIGIVKCDKRCVGGGGWLVLRMKQMANGAGRADLYVVSHNVRDTTIGSSDADADHSRRDKAPAAGGVQSQRPTRTTCRVSGVPSPDCCETETLFLRPPWIGRR
jgi:hypothetical protein